MLFLLTYETSPGTQRTAVARFKETGDPPPAGVKMLGRWNALDGSRGAVVFDSGDPVAIGKWAQKWADVITMHLSPVADDETEAKILA